MAIARAVYSQAETVILDDCLSAVDAHTAKHLYEHCITGSLSKYSYIQFPRYKLIIHYNVHSERSNGYPCDTSCCFVS